MSEADIARVAAAIGDPSRTRVLLALASGTAMPASALAAEAGVSNSTISGHLAKLLDAKLLTVELDGRHRYYRLATTDVARALEQLAKIAQPLPTHSLREDARARALLRARLCYDHLAGRLGVTLMAALTERDILAATAAPITYHLTDHGRRELTDFGLNLDELPRRRTTVRYCVDWAERRHHLAGALGAAITAHLFALAWLRPGRSPRVVHLSPEGADGLTTTFGLRREDL